jgi:hypothetical protein
MSLKMLFLLFVTFSGGSVLHNDTFIESNNDLLLAAEEVISKSFKPNALTINFISALSNETKREWNILINNLVVSCGDVAFVEDADDISHRHRHRLYNVIFIDNFKSFLRLFRQMSENTFVIDGYYLIIFLEGEIPELPQITKHFWSIFIHNVGLLVKAKTGLSLLTFLPFLETNCVNGKCEKSCGDPTPIIFYSFAKNRSFVGSFYPEKMMNLFNCPIKVVTFNCPPMMMISYDSDGKYQLKGIDGEILKVLGKILNFDIELIHISDSVR